MSPRAIAMSINTLIELLVAIGISAIVLILVLNTGLLSSSTAGEANIYEKGTDLKCSIMMSSRGTGEAVADTVWTRTYGRAISSAESAISLANKASYQTIGSTAIGPVGGFFGWVADTICFWCDPDVTDIEMEEFKRLLATYEENNRNYMTQLYRIEGCGKIKELGTKDNPAVDSETLTKDLAFEINRCYSIFSRQISSGEDCVLSYSFLLDKASPPVDQCGVAQALEETYPKWKDGRTPPNDGISTCPSAGDFVPGDNVAQNTDADNLLWYMDTTINPSINNDDSERRYLHIFYDPDKGAVILCEYDENGKCELN